MSFGYYPSAYVSVYPYWTASQARYWLTPHWCLSRSDFMRVSWRRLVNRSWSERLISCNGHTFDSAITSPKFGRQLRKSCFNPPMSWSVTYAYKLSSFPRAHPAAGYHGYGQCGADRARQDRLVSSCFKPGGGKHHVRQTQPQHR